MSLRVALRIFDERAMRHLSSIVSLASQRASSITLVGASERGSNAPEVIVICEDEPGAELLLKASVKSDSPRVVVYGNCRSNHPWVLHSPATTESLQRLLEKIVLAPIAQLPLEAANSVDKLTLVPIEPQPLLQDIAKALAENRILEIFADSLGGLLYIDGVNDCVHASGNVDFNCEKFYRELLRIPIGHWRWLSQLPRSAVELQHSSIESMIWRLCYAQPLHRLDENLLKYQRFQLQRWPYFSQFPYSSEQLSCSAKLMYGALSLQELAESVQVPLKTVCAFYNACVYTGIADISAVPVKQAVRPQSAGKRLLNALLRRLRGTE